MREPDERDVADTCPRCGAAQVEVDRLENRVRLSCPTCQYEVTKLDAADVHRD
jgi:uncharacterized Zn finger protein (UPF0148 family)